MRLICKTKVICQPSEGLLLNLFIDKPGKNIYIYQLTRLAVVEPGINLLLMDKKCFPIGIKQPIMNHQ